MGQVHGSHSGAPVIVPTSDPTRVVTRTPRGIWDYYEEKHPDRGRIPRFSAFHGARDVVESLPYVVRALRDIISIPGCRMQVGVYVVSELAAAVVPGLSIWYDGLLLRMMERAVETGTVDPKQLALACAGRIACTFAAYTIHEVISGAHNKINARIRRSNAVRSFALQARLDVPTSELPDVMHTMRAQSRADITGVTVLWDAVHEVFSIFSASVQLSGQFAVLFGLLRGQGRAMLVATLPLIPQLFSVLRGLAAVTLQDAWVLTTNNADYLKIQGWKRAVASKSHRKEIVAGSMAEFSISEYAEATERLGDDNSDPREMRRMGRQQSLSSLIQTSVTAHLAQITFALYAMRSPGNLAEFLATLNVVESAGKGFSHTLHSLIFRSGQLGNKLSQLRDSYKDDGVANVVRDGTGSLPSGSEREIPGVSIEFRNVSFKYPGSDKYALRSVSFNLLPGQLCVIVGANGAGKSTILKLAVRLYDPDEGDIFVDGLNIRTLRLKDLRRTISVLFQDYTHFPFSIRDNIALGDPENARDDERVRLAAQLGGAEAFIEKLPDGFATYINKPGMISGGGPKPGSKTRSGKPFDNNFVWQVAGLRSGQREQKQLSGGEMQRLAVSRTFMRSVVRDNTSVGLLLFDEPSASLDPIAEHDLFDRLRQLRGSKTMVFSSHRFGKLTRHADLILYMDDSGVVESGGHEELLARGGDYARLWKLQAQAFT